MHVLVWGLNCIMNNLCARLPTDERWSQAPRTRQVPPSSPSHTQTHTNIHTLFFALALSLSRLSRALRAFSCLRARSLFLSRALSRSLILSLSLALSLVQGLGFGGCYARLNATSVHAHLHWVAQKKNCHLDSSQPRRATHHRFLYVKPGLPYVKREVCISFKSDFTV